MRKFWIAVIAAVLVSGLQAKNVKKSVPFRPNIVLQEGKPERDIRISPPQPITWFGDTVSFVFVGDVMMHALQLEYDYRQFLAPISPYLSDADFAVANLEFTLAGEPYSGYPAFSAPDGYAQYLAHECGIDVFLTANNHILDKGSSGFKRTLEQYQLLRPIFGVRYTGSGLDEKDFEDLNPLIVRCKGMAFALVNFTYGTNIGGSEENPIVFKMSEKEIAEAIQRAKDSGADFIIALPHWGEEYKLKHNDNQEKWAKWLIGQGVDIIIGAHPHVVQDWEYINGVPVIYSLGNLVSNMQTNDTRKGLVVKFRFVRNYLTKELLVLEPEFHHTWCTLPASKDDNFRVEFTENSTFPR